MQGYCEICHKWTALEVHHVFNGAFRKKSEQYGAVVEICRECHDDLHHHHPAKYVWLKREWQGRSASSCGSRGTTRFPALVFVVVRWG